MQMTRSQVLGLIAAGNKAKNNGDIDSAIEKYKTIIDSYANYALPYRLMAQIYEEKEDSASISTAIVLYRKYVNLELDDENREEAEKTLALLEDKINAPHFKDYSDSITYKTKEVQALEDALQETEEEITQEIIVSSEAKEADKDIGENKALTKNYALSITMPERTPSFLEKVSTKISAADLNGRWVSDCRMQNGKEAWILDMKINDGVPRVVLTDNSGLLNTKAENIKSGLEDVSSLFYVYRTLRNKIKFNYSSPQISGTVTEYSMQAIPTMTRTVDGKIENEKNLLFSFQCQYEHHANSSKWETVSGYLKGVVTLLPLVGSFLGDVVEQGISLAVSQDKDYKTQSKMDFKLQLTGNGMKGSMQEKIKMEVKDMLPREDRVDRTYSFYKVDDDYTGFECLQKSEEQLNEEKGAMSRIEEIPNKADRLYCQAIADCYNMGSSKLQDFNPVSGLKKIKKAADAGHKEAKKLLAEQYYRYTTMKSMSAKKGSNYKKLADAIITKLVENNYTEGKMLQADCMYNYGSQKEPQLSESAINIYRELEEKAYLPAVVRLGYIYASSSNEKTQKKGREKLEQASKMGSADAELFLAKLALQDDNLEDYAEYLNKALSHGSFEAIEELSKAYRMGYGVKQDVSKSNKYYNDYFMEQSKAWKRLIGSYLK